MIYLDANNLRGDSMVQDLSKEILNWINPEKFNLGNYSDNVPIECILEVDLNYPDELHVLHNDLSFNR